MDTTLRYKYVYLWQIAFWYELCTTLYYMNRVQYLHELT
jgi:hypothetical protein